jgi:hypothetical protein
MRYFRKNESEVFGYDATQVEFIDQSIILGWEEVTGAWPPVFTPSQSDLALEALAQLDALFTPRRLTDAVLTTEGKAWLEGIEAQKAELRAQIGVS